ncbi:MAG: hypothetical protein CMP28_10990 [Roseibacillus sp.]|nr:hypothetical protein [Roseibacillus sp.]
MRYAIFSDVHANRQAWEAVREDFVQQGADTLVCLGDVVGYGPRPLEVLSAVRAVTSNFVLGNHDAAACGRLDPAIFNDRARLVIEWTREQLDQESLNFLLQVPLQMDGQELQFVHAEMREPGEFGYVDGIGPAELNLRAMTASLGFIGHTHLPLAYAMARRGGPVKQLPPRDFTVERGQRYIVNVGSVGEPRTTDVRASYVIYDDVARTVSFRRVAFDVEGYKEDLAESGLGILPYFVQVVDAGKVAGAPQPAAAPQLALAQLPKVAEVVAGGHGRLVVGRPGPGSHPAGIAPMMVSRPRSSAPWVIAIVSLLAILLVVIVIALNQGNPDEAVAAGEGTPAAKGQEVRRPAPVAQADPAPTGREGSIKDLRVWHYSKNFRDLEELRAKWAEENPEENRDENAGEKVTGGMLDLKRGGKDACGLVWEGDLVSPETGPYDFKLKASSGAALLIFGEEQLVSTSGKLVSVSAVLRGGRNPVRVEFFQQGGEQRPDLDLRWSGPGLEGELPLVRRGGDNREAVAGNAPEPAGTEPAPEPVRPEKISQDLFAYWAFERPPPEVGSRFTRTDKGEVLENLIIKGQPLRYLRPVADPGSLTRWTEREFDDSTGWLDGKNGIGYEDTPGDFKGLLETRIKTEKGKHPHSLYLRIPFEVKNPKDYQNLALYIKYDDGCRISLNGSVVSQKNDPFPFLWNSGSKKKRNDRDALKADIVKFGTRRIEELVPGTNILAIHALNDGEKSKPNATNTGCTSTDMLFLAKLVGLRKDNQLPVELQAGKPGKHDRVISKDMIRGTVTQGEGKFGESYNFEGGSLDIGGKTEYAIADRSYTVSLWFTSNPEAADGEERFLISAGGSSAEEAGWALWIPPDGNGLNFRLSDGDRASDLPARREGLADGKWHHAVVTIDRENKKVHLFVDGVLSADPMGIDWLVKTLGSGSGLCIGGKSGGRHFHLGKVDDVALWQRALLPEEVEKLFQAGTSAGDLFATEEQ